MSKYFAFVGDEPYDFEFKKHGTWDHWKKFYLGEHFICFVIKDSHKAGWTAIVNVADRNGFDAMQTPIKVEGFVSRHAAVDYALQVHPKTRDHYNSDRRNRINMEKFLKSEEGGES